MTPTSSTPARGPHLDPQALASALMSGRWAEPEVHATVASTNEEALRDPVSGRVVLAEHQSAGRGRLGRSWTAPPGGALALSAVLTLPDDRTRWGWAPLLVGVAATRALAHLGVRAVLKWPNDILILDGAHPGKLGGILCQAVTAAEPVVVAGIGINLDLADEVPDGATSVQLNGDASRPVSMTALAGAVLEELAQVERDWNEGDAYAQAQHEYRTQCSTVGRSVRIDSNGSVIRGQALDIDAAGALVIDVEGTRRSFPVGDVVHVRTEDTEDTEVQA
ncbi:biotin--[acetyl-CoA-carboxylase] ligase [Dermacoccaceae bacterium W4C1]